MQKVTACIDGSSAAPAVCDYAAWASMRMAAPLLLLHVLDKSEYPPQADLSGNIGLGSREALLKELAELDEKRSRLALEQGRLMLEAARERAIADGVAAPEATQRHGSLVETVAQMEPSIRLLVMGRQGERGESAGNQVGSQIENVVRTMHRPILITPPSFAPPQSLMVAFDGSETTRKGVEMIAASPLFRGLPCHLIMVGADTQGNRDQLAWARHKLEAADFQVSTALVEGDVESTVCAYRKENSIDMLVMGAYGHSRIRRFLVGSTTTSVMHNANVPVLLLR